MQLLLCAIAVGQLAARKDSKYADFETCPVLHRRVVAAELELMSLVCRGDDDVASDGTPINPRRVPP